MSPTPGDAGHVDTRRDVARPGRRGRELLPDIDGSQLTLVRGEGVYVTDAHGRTYLDAVAGIGVMALGYGRRDLVDAAARQASLLPYVHSLRYRNEPQEQLAQGLAGLTPEGINWFFFCSGGSEAFDSALKLIRLYWLERGEPERHKVIGRRPSFHGNTLAALSIGYHAARRRPYTPMLLDEPHLDAPWVFRCPRHGPEGPWCATCSGEALADLIEAEDPGTVAAFVAEPIVGAAAPGVTPPAGYFETIRAICDRYGVLFVSDEVMTGLGRTGRYFGIEHWNAVPDLMIVAKALGSGYAPLAAVCASDQVVDVLRSGTGRFEHNFTMAGHPVSCAVGSAVLRAYETEGIVAHAREMGDAFFADLAGLRRHPIVGDIRGRGLMAGVELTRPGTSTPIPPALRAAQRLDLLAREEGLLVYPCSGIVDGAAGDALLLLPPLVISRGQVSQLVDRLDRALARLTLELLPNLAS